MEETKKVDGRKNNGGHSTKGKAGRPPKITEKKLRTLSLAAIRKEFGSEDKMWRMIDGGPPTLISFPDREPAAGAEAGLDDRRDPRDDWR